MPADGNPHTPQCAKRARCANNNEDSRRFKKTSWDWGGDTPQSSAGSPSEEDPLGTAAGWGPPAGSSSRRLTSIKLRTTGVGGTGEATGGASATWVEPVRVEEGCERGAWALGLAPAGEGVRVQPAKPPTLCGHEKKQNRESKKSVGDPKLLAWFYVVLRGFLWHCCGCKRNFQKKVSEHNASSLDLGAKNLAIEAHWASANHYQLCNSSNTNTCCVEM